MVGSRNSIHAQYFQIDLFLGGARNDIKTCFLDPYRHRIGIHRILDSPHVLAHSFRSLPDDDSLWSMENFMRAYISNGTITRSRSAFRTC